MGLLKKQLPPRIKVQVSTNHRKCDLGLQINIFKSEQWIKHGDYLWLLLFTLCVWPEKIRKLPQRSEQKRKGGKRTCSGCSSETFKATGTPILKGPLQMLKWEDLGLQSMHY